MDRKNKFFSQLLPVRIRIRIKTVKAFLYFNRALYVNKLRKNQFLPSKIVRYAEKLT
jgi:hypothetical protein